jgi:DnaJ like chaperone protein
LSAAESLAPRRLMAAWRYRIHRWRAPAPRPLPQAALDARILAGDAGRQLSFTFAVIALSARIACAGSGLSREKYAAFRDAFPLTGGICGKIRVLFALACDSRLPMEHYVTQVAAAFPRRLPLFTALVDRLFGIAAADGEVTREAERLLARAAHLLGVSPSQYSDIRDRYLGPARAHHVLGVRKRSPKSRIKQRYRELMRRYHPDRFAAQDLSPEVSLVIRLKASEINAAYQALTRAA